MAGGIELSVQWMNVLGTRTSASLSASR